MDIEQQKLQLKHQHDLLLAHVRGCKLWSRGVDCALCQSWCDRNDCPICMDRLGDVRETTRCEGYPVDGCGCIFHAACSDRWTTRHVRCPSCRRAPSSDAESESNTH